MATAGWLRGAAMIRSEEARAYPPQSDEARRNAAIAADLERRAEAAGMVA
jgi:hypothetical protein